MKFQFNYKVAFLIYLFCFLFSNIQYAQETELIGYNNSHPKDKTWQSENTGTNQTVLLQANSIIIDEQVVSGEIVLGAFYTDNSGLECGGFQKYDPAEVYAISLWGNSSEIKSNRNGFKEGEAITWLLQYNGKVYQLTPSYKEGNNFYKSRGMSVIMKLEGKLEFEI